MNLPWNEEATLVRLLKFDFADDQSSEILFEGPLIVVARKVREMKVVDRRGLRLSLPNRQVRPHTFQDDALSALVENIPR
jgi:hypothetical protein